MQCKKKQNTSAINRWYKQSHGKKRGNNQMVDHPITVHFVGYSLFEFLNKKGKILPFKIFADFKFFCKVSSMELNLC
jgi:hypothetical protein